MNQISQRIQALSPSATLAMSQKSAELKAQGVDVINMSVGEPDFNTPDFIKEAAKKAIDENYSRYTPVAGYLSLRQAICAKLLRENKIEFTPDCIVVGNGAKQELCNVILATINPGDEVIIPVPAWVSYVEMVKLAEGVTVEVYAGVEQDFKISPEQLEKAITPKTRMIMLNSPSNPTGSIYSRDELKGLADVLAKYPDIIILADEIYEHINFVGEVHSISEFESVRDRVVIVNGVSKAYAMTGMAHRLHGRPGSHRQRPSANCKDNTPPEHPPSRKSGRGRLRRPATVHQRHARCFPASPRPHREPRKGDFRMGAQQA